MAFHRQMSSDNRLHAFATQMAVCLLSFVCCLVAFNLKLYPYVRLLREFLPLKLT